MNPDTKHEAKAVLHIPLTSIAPSKANPRRSFPQKRLEELAASIVQKGVIQPIIVRANGKNATFEIVAGERRWRASKLAGCETIPCIQVTLTRVRVEASLVADENTFGQQAIEYSLIENLQREDVHFLDEAKGYAKLLEMDTALTPELLADKVGKPGERQ